MSDFREKLKPGDKVIVEYGVGGTPRIETVGSVTKQHVTLINDPQKCKWRKFGYGYVGEGGGFNKARLREATPEAVTEIKQAHHRSEVLFKISNFDMRRAPTKKLEQILAILESKD